MISYSEEHLTHFQCSQCEFWFSIADNKYAVILKRNKGMDTDNLWCPHCGHKAVPTPFIG